MNEKHEKPQRQPLDIERARELLDLRQGGHWTPKEDRLFYQALDELEAAREVVRATSSALVSYEATGDQQPDLRSALARYHTVVTLTADCDDSPESALGETVGRS